MRLKRFFLSAFILLCTAFPCSARKKAAVPLVSHEAYYDLSLYETKGGALSVVAARGTMTYKLQKTCGAYETETTFSLGIGYEISGLDTSFFKQKTTESTDACSFDFTVFTKETENDKEITDVSGTGACLKNKKKITLTHPLAGEVVLPRTVLYPVQQTKVLLDAAAKGKKFLHSYVYDGTKFDALHFVSTVVSAPSSVSAAPKDVSGDATLLSVPHYWFDMAFYNDTDVEKPDDGRPLYEAGVRYYVNGVSDEVIQDFGEYKLKSTLTRIKRLKDKPCPKK